MKRREFLRVASRALGAVMAPAGLPARRGTSGDGDRFVERWSWAMGQPVHLMLFTDSEQRGLDACAAALAELRRVEAALSLFDDASDLCELNRRAGRRPMRVYGHLRAVLAHCEHYRRATGGAFNAAVEPLMRVWGFHRPRRTAPSELELAEARESVAAAVIGLDGDVARLPSAHTQLDLGGIGVGYGIDRVLAALRAHGISCAFCDISGDCAGGDAPPGEAGWPVAIADPAQPGATVGSPPLRYAALATSSNRVSVIRYGALSVGHIMDPATGWPADAVVQASIEADCAVEADALSTAALVRGCAGPGTRRSHIIRTDGASGAGDGLLCLQPA